MPINEQQVIDDVDSLGASKQDLEPVTPHRSPEKMEPTVFPTLKPEKDGEEEEKPTRGRQREKPETEVEEEEEDTTTRRPSENDELRAAMSELATTVTKVVKEKPTAPAKQMTQAEMEDYWKVFKPDPKDLRSLFRGLPEDATPEQLNEHATVWKKFQDGLTRQAFQAAYNVMQQELAKRDEKIGAFESFREQQNARQVRSDFNSRYEALAEPKYDRILKAVAQEIEGDAGAKFSSNQQYFDELAKRSAEYIRELDPDFELGEPNKTKSTGKLPKLPRSGGGGGTGNTGRNGPAKRSGTEVTADRNDIDSLG